jgi:hypothetical protein
VFPKVYQPIESAVKVLRSFMTHSNPPSSPFFKGGIFADPLFGKEGKGRFLGGMRRELMWRMSEIGHY